MNSLRESYFRLYIQISHILKNWQVVQFTVSLSYRNLFDGYSLFSTNIAWVPFCTVFDFLMSKLMIIVNISFIIHSSFKAIYQPAKRNVFDNSLLIYVCKLYCIFCINRIVFCVVKQKWKFINRIQTPCNR